MRRSLGSLFIMASMALATAAAAVAEGGGGSVLNAYGGAGAYPAQVNTSGHPSGGTLPFTGLDLGIGLAVAIGLLALGVVLRRAGRRPEH